MATRGCYFAAVKRLFKRWRKDLRMNTDAHTAVAVSFDAR
jgi:hypothetical protein